MCWLRTIVTSLRLGTLLLIALVCGAQQTSVNLATQVKGKLPYANGASVVLAGTDTSSTANVYTVPTAATGICPGTHATIPVGMLVVFTPHANNSVVHPTLDICGFGSPDQIWVYGDAGLATGVIGVGSDIVTFAKTVLLWGGQYWQGFNPETFQGPTVEHLAAITNNHLQKVTSSTIPVIGDSALTELSTVFATNADSFDNSGSTTQMLVAKGPSAVASANAGFIFDTTNLDYHAFINGLDARIAAYLTSLTPTASQCAIWVASGSAWVLGSTACSSGGGGGVSTYSRESILLSGTSYFPVGGAASPTATEAGAQVAASAAATISGLSIQLGATPVSGNIVFTVRRCTPSSGACTGSDQTLTCTITNPAVGCSDTTHSFNAAQGDLLSIKAVVSATAATTDLTAQIAVGTSGVGVTSINSDTTAAQTLSNATAGGLTITDAGSGSHTFKITPVTSYRYGDGASASGLGGGNQIRAWEITLPQPVTFSGISVVDKTVDATGLYSVGFMDTTGHALCHQTDR